MRLSHLTIHHVRNLRYIQCELNQKFTIFYGKNASGKTSLLESIYLLSRGSSFRTRDILPLITHGELELTVFARTSTNESVSIQKSTHQPTEVKINQDRCSRSSELAYFLPTQVFYQDIFHIIDAGPAVRRMVLDWGLFHVKQSYHEVWNNYRRVLKQRNALLRQKASPMDFVPWDNLLVELSMTLHQYREAYCEKWKEVFYHFLPKLTDALCDMRYYKGWDKRDTGKDLKQTLVDQFHVDMAQGYTHSGAHQADILLNSVYAQAKQTLSRGQQKIVLIALRLAQAQLIGKPCLYLFDDVASELDGSHLQRLMMCLSEIEGQFCITALDEGWNINSSILCKRYAFVKENEKTALVQI